ncbi:uncharacterized protein LOC123966306 [Micropterus dolomieu]|uniref:uncharacterized protein LOC123966306 n=1 Tax=Micropterus dolomieu TaxID=147949 RepID=UPI001E8CE424|nr:uncharacterized protein LOC123966306 [Micropterus dolomieu]
MGNMQCPAEDAALLASVARDICPFPNYNPNPVFKNMLSMNSSLHLRNHYEAVQSSLTPKQLDDFTQGLRTTFGREGNVTLGGVGVVALSLAVLFDTLARRVRGEWESESGPIPGLFVKSLIEYYPPSVSTVSEYLRLVPHIANNPTRMREESERYFKQLAIDIKTVENSENPICDDVTVVNHMLGMLFQRNLRIHLLRISNSSVVDEIIESVDVLQKTKENTVSTETTAETGGDAAHVSKIKTGQTSCSENHWFHLNCDPEAASIDFLAEVQKSHDTQKAFKQCHPSQLSEKTWLEFISGLAWLDVIFDQRFIAQNYNELLSAQREDFDLKANALRKWAE